MASKAGPKIVSDGIVLHLDACINDSYAGERLDGNTNLASNTNDYTGSSYGSSSEWSSDATQLTKTYHAGVKTPIGKGATMIQESGGTGYHHISRYGGSEMSGSHTLSFYFRPLSDDWGDDLRVGMLGDGSNGGAYFNLNTGVGNAIGGTSTDSRLVLIKKLKGGWWFIACDFHGRSGGWVGCLGPKIHTSYTGTVGAKKAYICGINYNNKSYAIPSFDRSGDLGYWQDLSPDSNHGSMTNIDGTAHETHYRNGEVILPTSHAYINFDGTDAFIELISSVPTVKTVEVWFNPDVISGDQVLYGPEANGGDNWLALNGSGQVYFYGTESADTNNFSMSAGSVSAGNWYQSVATIDGTTATTYLNGNQVTSSTKSFTIGSWAGGADIGRRGVGGRYYNGKISVVRVYDKVLTASEIKSNFNALRSRYGI